jgi:peptidyl-tRNA hydrolase
MAQAVHAAIQFTQDHPARTRDWHTSSNNVVILAIQDQSTLLDLVDEATRRGIITSLFREPDLDDQATAVALQPGAAARRLCANLPCARRKVVVV